LGSSFRPWTFPFLSPLLVLLFGFLCPFSFGGGFGTAVHYFFLFLQFFFGLTAIPCHAPSHFSGHNSFPEANFSDELCKSGISASLFYEAAFYLPCTTTLTQRFQRDPRCIATSAFFLDFGSGASFPFQSRRMVSPPGINFLPLSYTFITLGRPMSLGIFAPFELLPDIALRPRHVVPGRGHRFPLPVTFLTL